jgi:hypothetical protein
VNGRHDQKLVEDSQRRKDGVLETVESADPPVAQRKLVQTKMMISLDRPING